MLTKFECPLHTPPVAFCHTIRPHPNWMSPKTGPSYRIPHLEKFLEAFCLQSSPSPGTSRPAPRPYPASPSCLVHSRGEPLRHQTQLPLDLRSLKPSHDSSWIFRQNSAPSDLDLEEGVPPPWLHLRSPLSLLVSRPAVLHDGPNPQRRCARV